MEDVLQEYLLSIVHNFSPLWMSAQGDHLRTENRVKRGFRTLELMIEDIVCNYNGKADTILHCTHEEVF